MSKPIISIIIPVYNTLRYLPRCIDSIVYLQECTDKIEVILVDDGSTDGVERYIDLVAEKYSFVNAMHFKKNVGCSKCRNSGLGEAKGEYVFFCDSDDQFAPHALDKMIEHAFEWRPDIMAVKLNSTTSREFAKSMFTATNPDADIYSKISRTLGPWKLWRKKFLLDNSLEFPNAWPDDSLFVVRAYLLAKKISIAADQDYYFFETRPEGGHDSDAGLNKQSVLLYNSAIGHLSAYKQYADHEKGKRYLFPRILEEVEKCFRSLLLNNDPDITQKEKWILYIKEILLSICSDKEYLKLYESANIGDYVGISALMDFTDFGKAKKLEFKSANEEWQEEKSDESGCLYSLGDFKFDARYFFYFAIDIKNIEYSSFEELVISGNAVLNNFQPEIIYGSKSFLKATDGGEHDRVDFQMEPVKKSDGYSFKAKLNLHMFGERINILGLKEKCMRWDVWISIGGFKAIRIPIDINNRTDLFTSFSGFIESNKNYTLIPYVSGGGLMCFLYLGMPNSNPLNFWCFRKKTALIKDFLRKIPNRPLVNELAVRMINKKDFTSLRQLANDVRAKKIKTERVSKGVFCYNGNKYNIGSSVCLESQLSLRSTSPTSYSSTTSSREEFKARDEFKLTTKKSSQVMSFPGNLSSFLKFPVKKILGPRVYFRIKYLLYRTAKDLIRKLIQ